MPKLPKFKSLKEESEFWDTHSLADYWDELEVVHEPFVDARPKKKPVSIRFDEDVIEAAKQIARVKGVGYQTLLRMWAYEGLARELDERRARRSGTGAAASRSSRRRSA